MAVPLCPVHPSALIVGSLLSHHPAPCARYDRRVFAYTARIDALINRVLCWYGGTYRVSAQWQATRKRTIQGGTAGESRGKSRKENPPPIPRLWGETIRPTFPTLPTLGRKTPPVIPWQYLTILSCIAMHVFSFVNFPSRTLPSLIYNYSN
jgi:hypothetical protein